MKTAKLQQKRRRELTRMVRSLTVVCTVWFASGVESASTAQEPSCGCESSPVCDGGCNHPTYRKKPKSLSFAEKILKHFDHVGDKIEAEHRPRSSSRSFSIHRSEPQCGAEMGPTCGCEAAPSGCDCHACTSQSMQGYTHAYPGQPFAYTNAAPQGARPFSPATPMHPNTPVEKQAIGKISDKSSSRATAPSNPNSTLPTAPPAQIPVKRSEPFSAPKLESPSAPPVLEATPTTDEPAPMPSESRQTLEPSKQNLERRTPTEKPESPVEPFTPRFPKAASEAPSLRNIPTESNSTGYPAKRPTADVSPAPLPPANLPSTGLPPAGLPPAGLPSSTNEQIPDVLVDPFQDDVTWQGKRNQMNGIKLTVGADRLKESISPAKDSTPAQLKTVPQEELDQPLPIILTPAGPIESGNVIQSSYREALPVITNQVPKAKVIHFNQPEDYVPTVKRKAVPAPK